MKAVFWNKTVLGLRPVQDLALRHKDGRTGRRAEGHSHHEWCFCGFCKRRTRIARITRMYCIHHREHRESLFVSLVRFSNLWSECGVLSLRVWRCNAIVFKNKSTCRLESSVDSMPLWWDLMGGWGEDECAILLCAQPFVHRHFRRGWEDGRMKTENVLKMWSYNTCQSLNHANQSFEPCKHNVWTMQTNHLNHANATF